MLRQAQAGDATVDEGAGGLERDGQQETAA